MYYSKILKIGFWEEDQCGTISKVFLEQGFSQTQKRVQGDWRKNMEDQQGIVVSGK